MQPSDHKPIDDAEFEAGLQRLVSRRPVKRIRVSPEYAAFLEDELDSDSYARTLVSACRHPYGAPTEDISHSSGPASIGERPPIARKAPPLPPEYNRFLRQEISSREYAVALARYAHLEERLRAPSRIPSRAAVPGSWGNRLWHRIGYALLSFIAVVALPLAIYKALEFAPMAREWGFSMLGIVLLTATVIAAWSSTLRDWVQSPPTFSED